MSWYKRGVAAYFALAIVFALAGTADAQRRNERQVRDIVRSLRTQLDNFDYNLKYQLRSSSADPQEISEVTQGLRNLRGKIDVFETNLTGRRENRDDVAEIITAAGDIEGFLRGNPQNRRVESEWTGVRDLINRLAANYSVSPDWTARVSSVPRNNDPYRNNDPDYRDTGGRTSLLNGTYQLDTAKSDDTARILADTRVQGADRDDLRTKLDAPAQIAISVSGERVTLASSKNSPVTIYADGRDTTEQINGRSVKMRAAIEGDKLTVSSLGGETDYTIIFAPMYNGRTMKVTRRITTEYLNETVFADSLYTRTDDVARLGIDRGGYDSPSSSRNDYPEPPVDPQTSGNNDPIPTVPDEPGYSSNDSMVRPPPAYGGSQPGRIGEHIVPNGLIVTAMLENSIDTSVSQNYDRFRLTVQSPDEFRGAVIEGYLTGIGRSGRVSGRPNFTMNFQKITLRNGRSYDFNGTLQDIKDQNGRDIRVDEEGTARGSSQTTETVKRGGIGAGIGAIIGAIAGGGQGAAIGAIIGGSAGAGSVVVQGRDDIELTGGTVMTIQASSPIRNDNR